MSERFNRDCKVYETFFECRVGGTGLWSNAKGVIHIRKVEVESFDGSFGEVRAFFYPNEWDVNELGLIYTDDIFLNDLRICLQKRLNVSAEVVDNMDYSEQGMQGNDYVSFDVGFKFLNEVGY